MRMANMRLKDTLGIQWICQTEPNVRDADPDVIIKAIRNANIRNGSCATQKTPT